MSSAINRELFFLGIYVTLFSNIGKSIKIDMTKMAETELEFQNSMVTNFLSFFS